ncbi:hypothetical protein [Glycomyces sp. NPDC047010]|uniref:hypothetical protein n=1 Tax=Glycomyces sp. NPDC047010 TaxID=3155023 RepID=UPI0033FFDD71
MPSAIVRLTLKEDGPPWLTIESGSAADIIAHLDDKPAIQGLLQRASAISAYWRGLGGQNHAANARPAAPAGQRSGYAATPGPQTAPGGERRVCDHGEMTWKAGVSANSGKPYSGWFCPGPRGSQCAPQWPDKGVGAQRQSAPAPAYGDAPPF